MKISRTAQVGTPDASDIMVMVSPNDKGGVKLEIQSKPVVMKQFGRHIEEVIRQKVEEMGVTDIVIKAKDNGALDYVIRARLQAAIEKAVFVYDKFYTKG
ncbi:citrate lyase acyl carrier protein [Syntrophobotulus glycolicus DSM 8271]|uniref:Citrate lyase acyl carrier protein n=1 Tax=Syntrophobotulus glycolicus (strain DSM 8271 / FlGlyR) TaxID=645991 RepID=F0T1S1_SYNGF|nr:citrate lyase acyl carrier protein [Syntrophobotulus glycolicus]ADY57495.1 citrate lyase acyl carrier protein [Syntrophobotulus glycolicus DSM 8271]